MDTIRPLVGHSLAWQRAYFKAFPEDKVQTELVSQLGLPIKTSQMREQALRADIIRNFFSGLERSVSDRLYARLKSSRDSLGTLFHLTLHPDTRASLMTLLEAGRNGNQHELSPWGDDVTTAVDDARKYPTFGLYFRRYAPFDTFGAGNPLAPGQRFEGDHRTAASTSLKATARTYGCVMFNKYGLVYKFAGTSGTHIHELIWGDVVSYAKIAFTVVRGTLAGPSLFEFSAKTSASNPLIPLSPNIATIVNARVDFGIQNLMRINGEVFGDSFPNLEVFLLCYRSTHTAVLIDGRTTGSRDFGPATRLIGSHSDLSLGKFSANLVLSEKGELVSDYKSFATTLPS